MRSLRARVVLLLLAALVAGCEPATEAASRSSPARPDDSLIAFTVQGRDDLNPIVAVMPAAGGTVTRLRPGMDPAWSPDGQRLAFTCHPGICTMGADGSDVRTLTRPRGGAIDEQPAWGPTGEIAFSRTYMDGTRGRDIFVVRESSHRPAPVVTPGANFDPTWSPDGRSIAFIRGLGKRLEAPRGGFQLWTMSSRGGDLLPLTDEGAGQPDWGPDGSVVFEHAAALWLIPAAGGEPRKLEPATNGRGIEGLGSFPSWSPDGARIAYMCSTGEFDDNDLCVMDADGSGRRTILDTAANEASPAWQPSVE